ncbi:MAG: DNA methyltransferase [Acidobacteriota bacterium]|nr:site-specific DNA-methyltransferase [Blastocatellia bacterium]MDW8239840.1 DNA methyltransferase [Acidobacteriota bacterium]
MAHLSEGSHPLVAQYISVQSDEHLCSLVRRFPDVCMLILPPCAEPDQYRRPLQDIGSVVAGVAQELGPDATLITVGEVIDLVQVQAAMPAAVRYQHWIAIKRASPRRVDQRSLPNHHFGALIHTRYQQSLRHTKTRIKYTYCPACHKTTKDYGGKKHTYHEYGTLVSDVWRDVVCDLEGDLTPIIDRFRDLFGIDSYKELLILDCRQRDVKRVPAQYSLKSDWNASFIVGREGSPKYEAAQPVMSQSRLFPYDFSDHIYEATESKLPAHLMNQVLHGDCLQWLREIPDDSVDFVFADPPYNLGKNYLGYSDDLEIREYFNWCDQWIAELVRVLKPGRTLTLLNIPLWAIRHFLFMDSTLQFQNWIVWDALAFPVRLIMPAHYTILAFSKGKPRELPGLIGEADPVDVQSAPDMFKALEPLAEGYCLRATCVKRRRASQATDRGPLTDLWWDIHRLKHNTRRVDHPTQLPPHLMYRLIAIFTKRGEVVLDCFNGAGTTTLAAHQMERCYVGIEKSKKYCDTARNRHEEIFRGLNPFRKAFRELTAKNSPVPRLPKQKYEVPKKTLQLEVKRVAQQLGHLPSRDELAQYGKFPIRYYDEYFISWGEVCAAARTTGMTEELPSSVNRQSSVSETQLRLSFELNNHSDER